MAFAFLPLLLPLLLPLHLGFTWVRLGSLRFSWFVCLFGSRFNRTMRLPPYGRSVSWLVECLYNYFQVNYSLIPQFAFSFTLSCLRLPALCQLLAKLASPKNLSVFDFIYLNCVLDFYFNFQLRVINLSSFAFGTVKNLRNIFPQLRSDFNSNKNNNKSIVGAST